MQVVLNAQGLELGAGGGVQPGTLAAVEHVDLIHIPHQRQSLLFSDIFVQGAAEIVGNIVLAVRESARAAKPAHDAAAFTADTGLDLIAVNGTAALVQRVAGFEHGQLQLGTVLHQFVGGKNTAGARTDDDNVIFIGLRTVGGIGKLAEQQIDIGVQYLGDAQQRLGIGNGISLFPL